MAAVFLKHTMKIIINYYLTKLSGKRMIDKQLIYIAVKIK